MIDLRTAVSAAYDYMNYLQDMMGNQLEDLRLEEVEISEDQQFWLITLGFERPVKNKTPFTEIAMISKREYKVFKVNSQIGAVEAMKIREV